MALFTSSELDFSSRKMNRKTSSADRQASAADFWKAYLLDADPCHFPQLIDRLGAPAHRRRVQVDLEADGERLERFCGQHGVTLPVVVQTAWALVLGRYADAEEVAFGFAMSRSDSSGETVCRARLHEAAPLADLLQDMQTQHVRGWPHRQNPASARELFLSSTGPALFNTKVRIEIGDDRVAEEQPAEVSLWAQKRRLFSYQWFGMV